MKFVFSQCVKIFLVWGDIKLVLVSTVLDRPRIAEIEVLAAGVAGDTLVVLVPKRSGANALQIVEREG
jgi:hypothetical protein